MDRGTSSNKSSIKLRLLLHHTAKTDLQQGQQHSARRSGRRYVAFVLTSTLLYRTDRV